MSIDWSAPLVGVPTEKGEVRGVGAVPVDLNIGHGRYHRSPGRNPVKFERNLWVNDRDGGTWYFDDDGESVGGRNQQGGQDALWSIRNPE